MDRNALDPERPSGLFGSWVRDNLGSASPIDRRIDWAMENPEQAQSIADKINLLMLALRSRSGAQIGRDNVMAGRLEKVGSPYDTAITGGSTAPRAGASWDNPSVAQSSTGLAYEPGMRYAGGERSRYASPGYETRWTEPANTNINATAEIQAAKLRAYLEALTGRQSGPPNLTLLPCGKKD